MANHLSAQKRIRANETKHLRNRGQNKFCRAMIKQLLKTKDPSVTSQKLKLVYKLCDKLAKNRIIHPNKSARIKSRLTKKIQHSAAAQHP